VLTVVGLLTLLSTITGLVLVGFDNTLDTGNHEFSTKTAAMASELGDLGDDSVRDRFYGSDDTANLKVEASGDQDLFLGVGPTDKVKEYLDQSPWEEVEAISAGRFSTSSDVDYSRRGRSGSMRELPAPTGESFWTEQKTGTKVDLDWDIPKGDYMVVLMNADGATDVKADGKIELEIPRLSMALVAGIIIGAILLLLGLLFLFKIGRRRSEPRGYPAPVRA
jgi:hypothetical protein